MYKKLSEEALANLLEAGICEFAEKGFDKASIADIAKKSDLSVGVLYKYFDGKDDFFLHCVRHSLEPLNELMGEIRFEDADFEESIELAIRKLVAISRDHSEYFLMYHEITSGGCSKFASSLAAEIETATAALYTSLIENAQSQGKIRSDISPAHFAFFFDNLLMMLHFSLSCEYYKKRLEIYSHGEPDLELLVGELKKFITAALGAA